MFNLCSSTWPKSQLRADWAYQADTVKFVALGFVAKLRLGDSSGESSALGGGYAQASLTKVSHDKLERV